MLYSLFGTAFDDFYCKFLDFRAVDQKTTADLTAKAIFENLINSSTKTTFNVIVYPKEQSQDSEQDSDAERISKQQPEHDSVRIMFFVGINL